MKLIYRVRAGAACATIGKALFDYTTRTGVRQSINPALGLGEYELRVVRESADVPDEGAGVGAVEMFVEVWTKRVAL